MNQIFECRLVSFDLDGTLVPNVSTGGFLAEKMGHAHAMQEAEALYAQGRVANDYVSTLDGQYYRGKTQQDVFDLLTDIPEIDGIAETVSEIQSRGVPVVLCTLAWQVVAEYFSQKYGFAAWSGPRLAKDAQGQFTGDIAAHFDEHDKPKFILEQCKNFDVTMQQVAHIGDSRSDIELFKQAGRAIAINATEDAKAVSHVQLSTRNLQDVLPHIFLT